MQYSEVQLPAELESALQCIAVHCIALHCIALHCIALYSIALHCIALHCIALNCIASPCIALHCSALHCIAVYCSALHGISVLLRTVKCNEMQLGAVQSSAVQCRRGQFTAFQAIHSYIAKVIGCNLTKLKLASCTLKLSWTEGQYWSNLFLYKFHPLPKHTPLWLACTFYCIYILYTI